MLGELADQRLQVGLHFSSRMIAKEHDRAVEAIPRHALKF
jgi:hypothetical protein